VAPRSAELALPAATNAIVRPANEQESRDTTSLRTASLQVIVGEIRPLPAGEAARLTISADDVGPNAVVVIGGLVAGAALSAGKQLGPNTWQMSAEELDRAIITPPRGFAGAMDLTLELRLAQGTVADRKSLTLEWMDRDVPAKSEPHNTSEITAMMKNGAQLMANGDVSGARSMYQRLAEEGEALAAWRWPKLTIRRRNRPARVEATLDVVRDAFKLATPVAAADVYAPGFVPK
jgi:hypothetical protein